MRTRHAVGAVLAAQAVVLTVLSGRHGFHRDELYFLAAGARPDWGYVDQPPITPLSNRFLFVPMQLVYLSPVLVPVWVAGLVRLWRDSSLRALAVAFPVLCGLTLLLGGKPYHTAPLLLVLVAAGAAPAVRWIRGRRWVIPVAAVAAAINVVFSLPVLPAASLGPVLAVNKEQGEEVGWPAFTASVARAWNQIPVNSTSVIFTRNYGQAGAIERYGPALGLPQPYSGHMSYADWGPPPDTMTGPVVVVGGVDTHAFKDCRVVLSHDNGIGLENDEQGTRISLCVTTAPWSSL